MKIGIDIMGGDFAPSKTIEGAVLALEHFQNEEKLFLFGQEKKIISELNKYDFNKDVIEIIDCSEVIEMGEHPTKAFKNKIDSSIYKGFEYLAKNKIDTFASAGNTGAMFIGGYYTVKPIRGVIRPSIATVLPKLNGKVAVLLDVGANADCKADVLYQFGVLGSLYAQNVYDIKDPKVSLLNLGEEKNKGNMLTQTAYGLMQGSKDYNFIGNIEANNIFESETDVIVCDGFTGNIVLKQAEGFYNLVAKRNKLDDYFKRFNYENYGGTPILGLTKPVIIGHGISNEIAIKNMILQSKVVLQAKLTSKIMNTIE
jgi:glycerol-3-phosphate acyltransferase PlsX|tara:strand:+ start:18041 stop:18979 length:939 start_codon:yes stop_codon:yes gene_type:complete